MNIPHSQPTLDSQDASAVSEAVLSGFVGSGQRVKEFESRVASLVGRRSAIAASSGSAALHLVLAALGIGRGAQVLLPGLLCRAVLNVVLSTGAEPVLADIDPIDFTMSVAAARRVINSKTRLILLPHMFGAPADLNGLMDLGVPVLEDAASSLGARHQSRPVGSFGIASVFSFGSTKMMTTGQGGMALVDDPDLLARLQQHTDYDGVVQHQDDDLIAYNYQLTDLQAALGLSQLERLAQFVERRRQIANYYSQALDGLSRLVLPTARPGAEHSYYRFIIRLDGDSEPVKQALAAAGIDARTSVSHFLYDYLNLSSDAFPVCEAVRHSLISLPIYPGLSDEQVAYVAEKCRQSLVATVSQ